MEKNKRRLSPLYFGVIFSLCASLAAPLALAKPGISSDGAAPAAVRPDSREDFEDMRVKVLGGYVRMNRRWTRSGWEWNRRWSHIEKDFKATSWIIGGDVVSCAVGYERIIRNGQTYIPVSYDAHWNCLGFDRLGKPGHLYHSQLALTFTKNDGWGDYTWRDRKGNLIFYQNLNPKYYEDKNSVRVTLEYDGNRVKSVKDHHGNIVITYHWEEYEERNGDSAYLLKKLEDYTGRSITYHYGEDSEDSLNYRQLIAVTDVRGFNWTYQYHELDNGKRTLKSMTDPNGRVTTYSSTADGDINGSKNADGVGTSYSHSYDEEKEEYLLTQQDSSGVITETFSNAAGMPLRKVVGGELQYKIEYLYSDNETADEYARQYSTGVDTKVYLNSLDPIRIISSVTTDARGLETKYYYDTFRNITRTEFADGSYTTTDWNTELTLPLRERDERGVITEYEYDEQGNLLTLTEALGTPDQRTTRYTYDEYGQMITETTGESVAGNTALATTTWDYDGYGNVIKVTDPEGNSIEYRDYDSNGNAKTIVDARQKTWTQDYDSVGNLISDLNPYGQGNIYDYDDTGHLVKVTDASGNSKHITNNASGLPLAVIDDAGNLLELDFDRGNRLVTTTDSEGVSIGLEYDYQNQLTAIIDGEQNRIEYSYQGNLLSKIEYPTYKEELSYDNRSRLVKNKQDANNVEHLLGYGYDLVGNLSSEVNALESTHKYNYDKLNRLVAIVDPVNGEDKKTEFGYDARDNLIQVKDPEGRLTIYTYDKNDLLKTESKHMFIGSSKRRVYSYDGTGNLIEVVNPEQERLIYSYDNANRLAKSEVFASKVSVSPIKVVDYYYNNKSQYVGYLQYPGSDIANATPDIVRHGETYSYDSLNRLESVKVDYYGEEDESESIAFSKAYSYSYYGNGQKKTYTNPEGITYTYYYNKNNQLAAVHIPGAGQLAWTNFQWLAPQTLLLPGGSTIILSYDDFLRVKDEILIDGAGNDNAHAIYEYDLESNIEKITTKYGKYNFEYDEIFRLRKASYPLEGLKIDEEFNYDGVSNRISYSYVGSDDVGDSFKAVQSQSSYNNNNQLKAITGDDSSIFKYNDNDHTIQRTQADNTWDYLYNHEERLITVNKNGRSVGEYRYDPYGKRIYKKTESLTFFLYNKEGMAAEYDSNGNLIKEYHFKPGLPWMTNPLFQRVSSGEVFYYQNDHLGTPKKMIDNSGMVVWEARYKSFGEVTLAVEKIQNNLRFAGQYYDHESGLYHNYMRDYSPDIGRYLESDPIGIYGGINPYIYANSNSIRYVDPEGLNPLGAMLGALCAAVQGGGPCEIFFGALSGALGPLGGPLIGGVGGPYVQSLEMHARMQLSVLVPPQQDL
ncbi:RHS repeat-associated core domain-containing protein [Microbulbifer sp. MKSA007]|nr:RHS repeat-associated core domain-containing protein [Microbulbifer sp. MKSA007]